MMKITKIKIKINQKECGSYLKNYITKIVNRIFSYGRY